MNNDESGNVDGDSLMKRLKVMGIEDSWATWVYDMARGIGWVVATCIDRLRCSAAEQTNPCRARALLIVAARIKWKIHKRAWSRAKQRA